MILNNYWGFKRAVEFNYYHYGSNMGYFHYDNYGVKDTSGNAICLLDHTDSNGDDYDTAYNNVRLNYENNILIGTGNDNAYDVDSYCLVDDITSSFSFVENSITGQIVNGVYKRIITVSGENTSGSSKTITELAFCRRMYYSATSGWTSSDSKTNVMLIVEPLDEPITVPAGEGFIATMEWETIQDEPAAYDLINAEASQIYSINSGYIHSVPMDKSLAVTGDGWYLFSFKTKAPRTGDGYYTKNIVKYLDVSNYETQHNEQFSVYDTDGGGTSITVEITQTTLGCWDWSGYSADVTLRLSKITINDAEIFGEDGYNND